MISVLLVDDHSLIRKGFRLILDAESDIEVAGEAADGTVALSMCSALRPDVVLMDVRMPGRDGIEATGPAHGISHRSATVFDRAQIGHDRQHVIG